MTFAALLECSVEKLESMSDLELLEHLGPTLKNNPPIELALIQAQELKEKEEKDKKKSLAKLEKNLAKPAKNNTKITNKKSTPQDLANMNLLMEQMKANLLKMVPTTNK